MASEMKMLKAETDPTKVEMMKKEMMMKAMKKMPEMSEMMKKEMMKQMDEYGSMNAMKEAVSPAQQAAIAISKKEKEKKEEDEKGSSKTMTGKKATKVEIEPEVK